MSDEIKTTEAVPSIWQIEAAALALANYDAAQVDCPLLASIDEFRIDADRRDYEARAAAALTAAWDYGKLTATSDDLGSSYFARAIGVEGHKPVKYEKYSGSHPVTINKVYQEALTRFPEAADVIAAMVFWRQIGFNRDEFIRSSEAKRETNNVE